MKLFSGFPDGKLAVTPLPNLFFSELLPAIDDLAELKVILHIFWLLKNRKANHTIYVTLNELRADKTIMQSLSCMSGNPQDLLAQAMDSGVQRGSILKWIVPLGYEGTGEELFFLNTEISRQAIKNVEQSAKSFSHNRINLQPAEIIERPNIYLLYEQNVGFLTPMIADILKDAEEEYPAEWIAEAIKVSVTNNKRSWSYIRAILARWKTDGYPLDSKKPKRWWDDEFDKYITR